MASYLWQVMATLQSTVMVPDLAEMALQSWGTFMRTLDPNDTGSYMGPTSAAFVTFWHTFSIPAKESAKSCLEYIVFEIGGKSAIQLDEMADVMGVNVAESDVARI